jgi:hypothetical protein
MQSVQELLNFRYEHECLYLLLNNVPILSHPAEALFCCSQYLRIANVTRVHFAKMIVAGDRTLSFQVQLVSQLDPPTLCTQSLSQ